MKNFTRITFQVFILIIILSDLRIALAQKEYYNWIFGRNCYITFDTPNKEPINVTKSQIDTWEGCTSMSDKDGNLLFYSNGEYVWTKNHTLMPNGTGLKGYYSSMQSGISFLKPGSKTEYYLFTIEGIERKVNGLNYSIIDMRLNNNLGDVSTKNIHIADNCLERITAVKHKNKKDMWVIAHRHTPAEYLVFLVTDKGVSSNPVISKGAGDVSHPNWECGLRASQDGKTVVSSDLKLKVIEIFDFNNETGKLTLRNKVNYEGFDWAYGFEISNNNKYLYASTFYPCQLLQYNISLKTDDEIKNSKVLLDSYASATFYFGAIQIAPNGKIYVAQDGARFLATITEPDRKGTDCDYKRNGFDVSALGLSRLGLPNSIRDEHFCEPNGINNIKDGDYEKKLFYNQIAPYKANNLNEFINNGSRYLFYNKNPLNINDNCNLFDGSNTFLFFHVQRVGDILLNYEVDVVPNKEYLLSFDIARLENKDYNYFQIVINGDEINYHRFYNTSLCQLDSIKASFSSGSNTKAYITIAYDNYGNEDIFGLDNFEFRLCGCDTLPSLSKKIKVCKKEQVELVGRDEELFFNTWSPSSYFKNPDLYKQKFTPGKTDTVYLKSQSKFSECVYYDTLYFELKPTDTLKVLGDDFICAGDSALIFIEGNYNDILWSNGKTSKNIYVTKPGKYDVICYDINGCEFVGSKELFAKKDTNNQIIGPDSVCNNDKYTLSLIYGAKTYKWSNGSTASTINAKGPGKFIVECTYEDACNTIDTIDVASLYPPIDVKILGKDEICKKDSVYIYVSDLFEKYTWSNGVKDTGMYVTKPGIYEVFCLDSNGCEHTGKIQIYEKPQTYNEIIAPDSVCIDESYSLKLKYAPKTIKWSTGSEDMIIYAKGPRKYYVECTYYNGDCDSYDSIEVFLRKPIHDLKVLGPTAICENDSAYISISKNFISYNWSNGSTDKGIYVNKGGTYTVRCIDTNGCEHIGSIDIRVDEVVPNEIIGPDSVCVGEYYKLQTKNPAQKYAWSTGGTSRLITANGPGKYYVECLYANGCKTYDSIEVLAKEPINDISINGDNYFCENDSAYIFVDIDSDMNWSTGENAKGIYVKKEGQYSVKYIDKFGCEHIGKIDISILKAPKPEIIGPDTVCDGDPFILDLKDEALEYYWSNGERTKSITCTESGKYIVKCVYEGGCKSFDTITVRKKPNQILEIKQSDYDLGDICRFNDHYFILDIYNPTSEDFRIDELTFTNHNAKISYVEDLNYIVIFPLGKAKLRINMDLGLESGIKLDTVRIHSYKNCKSVYEIYLKWRIIDGYAKVSFQDTLVAAGDYLCYPIYYESECKSKDKFIANYELEFDISKKVFKPESVTSGTMQITRVNEDINRVKIRDQYDVSQPNGIINYVCGTVYLSDSTSNHVSIISLKFDEFDNPDIEKEDGKIKLLECLLPLRQFVIFTPTNFSINPNISEDYSKIQLKTSEVGTFKFEVFDYTGNLVDTFYLNRANKSDSEELNYDLRLDNKTQGAYFIKLTAPWSTMTKSLMIVK